MEFVYPRARSSDEISDWHLNSNGVSPQLKGYCDLPYWAFEHAMVAFERPFLPYEESLLSCEALIPTTIGSGGCR